MNRAIGLIETTSIACGIEAADAMVKIAPVKLYAARPICPGKYMVLVGGDVEAVNSSLKKGEEVVREYLADSILIPNIHADVFPAIEGITNIKGSEGLWSLGVIETFTVASSIMAADAAAKAGGVKLLEIRPAVGLGGKSFVTMLGDVSAVESAVRAGELKVKDVGLLVKSVVIPSIARDVLLALI